MVIPVKENIESYPEFANPTQGYGLEYDALNSDWSLLENSPCVNYGTPDTNGYHIPEFDFEAIHEYMDVVLIWGQ